jgi:class 3 adenylate cyclase
MGTFPIGTWDEEAALLTAQRRLVAVLAADVVGYGRLTEAFEEETHTWLMRLRSEVLDPGVAAHRGRIIKNTGDGFLAMFESAQEATQCALALQRAVITKTAEQSPDQRISFRMAVNIADAIIEKEDIYGDGVNVAARLQAYAEPGGVVVAGAVAEQIGSGLGVGAIDLGDLILRNHARPVRVFALLVQTAPPRLIGDAFAGAEARTSIAYCLSASTRPIRRKVILPTALSRSSSMPSRR